VYAQTAISVGRLLAAEGIRVVYGGSAVGLMGLLADAVLEGGGEVVGVIPRGLFRREVAHTGLTELREVRSMHERKQTMFDLADGFVALPGGLGTLEELSEIASWAQLGIHTKPIATLDVSGFWSPFHAFLDHAAASGFITPANLRLVVNVATVPELLPTLRRYQAPDADKWIELDET